MLTWRSAADRRLRRKPVLHSSTRSLQPQAGPVDLVDLTQAGEPLLGQILTTGVRLMGSDETHARFLTRHLIEQADFLPYRDRILAERRQAWIDA